MDDEAGVVFVCVSFDLIRPKQFLQFVDGVSVKWLFIEYKLTLFNKQLHFGHENDAESESFSVLDNLGDSFILQIELM